MRDAGRVVRTVLDEVAAAAVAGVSTAELDRLAEARTRALGAVPAFKGYLGYPASVCISVNDEVVHGIPSESRILRDGDLVGLDFGAILGGFHGDAAETVLVGQGSPEAVRLLAATREALAAGVAAALSGRPGGGHRGRRPAQRRGPRVLGGPRVRRARHRAKAPRAAPGAQLRGARHGSLDAPRTGPGHRADGERGAARGPDPRATAGPRSPRTGAFPHISSTPWPSRRRVRRSSPGRGTEFPGAKDHVALAWQNFACYRAPFASGRCVWSGCVRSRGNSRGQGASDGPAGRHGGAFRLVPELFGRVTRS